MSRKQSKGKFATAIDLFAGCGGLTAGLKQAGFHVLGAVEIDPKAVEVYRLNHPEVHVFEGDIRDLEPKQFARKAGLRKRTLDLLAGCPPCQGFSTIRTLNGGKVIRDRRNGLLEDFLRFVEYLQPKRVMMENVPGLRRTRRFREFKARLRELGYLGKDDVLDAAEYGVPQRRKRLIYIAGRRRKVNFGNPAKKRKTVRDAIGCLPAPGRSTDPIHDIPERRSAAVIRRIKSIPKDGGSRHDLPRHRQLDCHKACDGFKDVYGRMSWENQAPTITTGCFNPSKGRFLHPTANRAITLREAALLQGFSKRYRFPAEHGKVCLALFIGNALPPPFIASHARSLKRTLQGKKQTRQKKYAIRYK